MLAACASARHPTGTGRSRGRRARRRRLRRRVGALVAAGPLDAGRLLLPRARASRPRRGRGGGAAAACSRDRSRRPTARRKPSLPAYERKLSNPEWVRESAQFYERRWVVPLFAAPFERLARRARPSRRLARRVRRPGAAALPAAASVVPAPARAARGGGRAARGAAAHLVVVAAHRQLGARVRHGGARLRVSGADARRALAGGVGRDRARARVHARPDAGARRRGSADRRSRPQPPRARSRRHRRGRGAAGAAPLRRASEGGDRLPAERLLPGRRPVVVVHRRSLRRRREGAREVGSELHRGPSAEHADPDRRHPGPGAPAAEGRGPDLRLVGGSGRGSPIWC